MSSSIFPLKKNYCFCSTFNNKSNLTISFTYLHIDIFRGRITKLCFSLETSSDINFRLKNESKYNPSVLRTKILLLKNFVTDLNKTSQVEEK